MTDEKNELVSKIAKEMNMHQHDVKRILQMTFDGLKNVLGTETEIELHHSIDDGSRMGKPDPSLDSEETPVPQIDNFTHPGVMLKEVYLDEMGLTPHEFADRIGVTEKTVVDLIEEKAPITVDMALRLAKAFGTGAQLWLSAQHNYDDGQELRKLRTTDKLKLIESVSALIGND